MPDGQEIEARFKSLHIYEIRGISSSSESPFLPDKIKHETTELSVSVGESINKICQVLIGQEFIDDEETWRKKNKCNPPYLVMLASAPDSTYGKNCYWKKKDGKITTYECFNHVRKTLKEIDKVRVYTFLTSLSAALSTPEHPVAFIPITREVFGVTKENEILTDFRITGKAELTVSESVTPVALTSSIETAFLTSRKLHPNVGYFFDLGTREKDFLKKFLYYYLAIEIHIHKEYERIGNFQSTELRKNIDESLGPKSKEFYIEYDQAKNLSQRFVWCFLLGWVDVGENDFIQFREIKKFRDHIYHGEEVSEGILPVNQARQLALKIFRHP